jgi:tetratricopeptide (TPR) repeat protein
VKETGQAVYDADKYAERFAKENQLPDKTLMKARLSTDGGYLDKALKQLSKFCFKPVPDSKDNIEFWYRKGRIYQLKGSKALAKENFKKVIGLSEGKNYYFAPNACLQLGYILQDEKDFGNARYYFEKAISYKEHEYKNSIDNKARAAISELPEQ